MWAAHRIRQSPFGLALAGIRENARRSEFAGVPVRRYRLAVFALSGAFAGLAGSLEALLESNARPFMAHWTHSAEPVLVSLLGGLASLTGPLVGSAIYIAMREIIQRFTENWMLGFGIVLLVIIMGFRGGVMGTLSALFRKAAWPRDERGMTQRHTTQRLSNHFGMVCTARDLDLRFEPGVLTSIIGPNGAGKSTLINLLTGHLPVQAGRIRFRGRDITRLPIHKRVRMGICRSFQVVNVFPELTVAQNVMIPVLARTGKGVEPIRSLSAGDRGRAGDGGDPRDGRPASGSATRPPPRSPTGTCACWRSAWRSPPPRRCCSSTSPPRG